jgi:hypothetical protein
MNVTAVDRYRVLIVLLDGRLVASGEPLSVLEHPPSRAVAEFLGFTGAVREAGGGVRCVRPAQVVLDPDGPLRAVVARRIPEEDGVLCEL